MNRARERFLVMHALAVKKHGRADDIAAVAGLDLAIVSRLLADLAATDRVQEADGHYLLSPLARVALNGYYSRWYGELRDDPSFLAANDRFERINSELKALITDWQMMTIGGQRVLNDHSDTDHDARIIDRLGALHERAQPVLADFERCEPRLGHNRRALGEALDRAEGGAIDWVSDARIPSYHTVWFELHEDLLRIAGRQRVE